MIEILKNFRVVSVVAAVAMLSFGQVGAAAEDQRTSDAPGEDETNRLGQHYGFSEMEVLKLEWQIGRPIVADINHDGLNDLIFTNNRKARIDLLLQKKGFVPGGDIPIDMIDEDVNDIFGREKTWRFKRVSYDLDVAASSLVVADLNNDKLLDMAFYAKDALRVVLQGGAKAKEKGEKAKEDSKDRTGPDEPEWGPPRKIDITDGLTAERALGAGDLNGDKRTDLGLLASNGVNKILQKGDGTLEQPMKYYSGASRPRQLDISDVNGDGRADVVILTGQKEFPVRVRYQTPDGKLGPEVRYELPFPSALEMFRLGDDPRSSFVSISQQSGRIRLSMLGPHVREAEYPVLTYPLPASKDADKRDMVAADVDGDGLRDVVVSDPSRAEFLLFRASELTGLTTPKHFPGLSEMQKLAAGVLDPSPCESIVALSQKEKTIAVTKFADGRLSFPESVSITGDPQAMDLADVDGDKKLDLVYISYERKTKKYHLRTVLGLTRSDEATGVELELTELKDKPLDLRCADIDHDGRTDVMILRPYGPVLLVRQVEAGKFEQVTRTDVHAGLVANVTPETLSVEPLGEGGAAAALLAKKNFARSVVFDPKKGWKVLDQYQLDDPESSLATAAAARIDPAGDLAIVTYDAARGKLGILTKRKDGTYRSERQVEVGRVSAKKIISGDFGGDSPIALLLCGTGKLILVPVASRTNLLRKVASFEPSIKKARYGALGAGDINSDGFPEILAADQGRHHLEIISFDEKGAMVSASKFKVFESPRGVNRDVYRMGGQKRSGEPRAVIVGDVTGDGKNDLILLVHDRIILYPQD